MDNIVIETEYYESLRSFFKWLFSILQNARDAIVPELA